MTGCPIADDDMPAPDSGADSGEALTDSGGLTDTSTGAPASDSGSGGAASVPWSDVECEMQTCEGSDICFKPPAYCTGPCVDNYGVLVNPPPRCEPFPELCDPLDPQPCLIEDLCDHQEGSFNDGHLTCYGAGDCYCR